MLFARIIDWHLLIIVEYLSCVPHRGVLQSRFFSGRSSYSMPQTTLTILALMLFAFFAISQQKRVVQTEQAMIRSAMAVMANGVATQTLDNAAAAPFDEATRNESVTSPSALTAKRDFGNMETLEDIDDWSTADVHSDSTLDAEVRTIRNAGTSGTITFVRKAEVNYVDKQAGGTWVVSASPTKYKQITVTVYVEGIAVADTVRLSRVVSCGVRCRW